jgi:hypothetical protein
LTHDSEVRTSSIITLMMEAVRTYETSVNFVTTLRYFPEDCKLHTRRHEKLKSYISTVSVFIIIIMIISFYSLVEHGARVKIRHLVLFAAKAFKFKF